MIYLSYDLNTDIKDRSHIFNSGIKESDYEIPVPLKPFLDIHIFIISPLNVFLDVDEKIDRTSLLGKPKDI